MNEDLIHHRLRESHQSHQASMINYIRKVVEITHVAGKKYWIISQGLEVITSGEAISNKFHCIYE